MFHFCNKFWSDLHTSHLLVWHIDLSEVRTWKESRGEVLRWSVSVATMGSLIRGTDITRRRRMAVLWILIPHICDDDGSRIAEVSPSVPYNFTLDSCRLCILIVRASSALFQLPIYV
uniref:Zinc finger homeobox protein 3 n=1 Tax=Parascaris univalens TaxID=6257 RepID=A0A914ZVX1_PARUN